MLLHAMAADDALA